MSSGSVLPAVAASGNTSSNEKMSRSFSPESASGRRSVSQDGQLAASAAGQARHFTQLELDQSGHSANAWRVWKD